METAALATMLFKGIQELLSQVTLLLVIGAMLVCCSTKNVVVWGIAVLLVLLSAYSTLAWSTHCGTWSAC